MHYIALAVIVVALLWLASEHPKIGFSLLGALALAAAVIVFGTRDDARWARWELPVEDVQIQNAVMNADYANSYRLNARVLNANAEILLKEFVISITMLDCADENSADDSCAVLGQRDERINAQIPPGQTRDIERNVSFHNATPSGVLRWRFKVAETRA